MKQIACVFIVLVKFSSIADTAMAPAKAIATDIVRAMAI